VCYADIRIARFKSSGPIRRASRARLARGAFPALSLDCNSSSVTAMGSDQGHPEVFERQLEAFAKKGDVVFALSTRGNSENVIRGIEVAKERGCHVIRMTGRRGGRMADLVPEGARFRVDSDETSIVQEVTMTVGHLVTKLAEGGAFRGRRGEAARERLNSAQIETRKVIKP